MPLRKSHLYSSLWQSCDQLRGGMDASQYKDYVLTLLFMKYVSDKYAGSDDFADITVPPGGGFADMVALKGTKEIGDGINKVISKLAGANDYLFKGVIDQADFLDESKFGRGKEMQDRLTKLVGIFEGLDFRANRAHGDDLLGDAYEYLMRHFATQSGKSKGQFYTPAEVSRIMAQVIGIGPDTRRDHTVYDPTCGSGSLLIKAADEAPHGLTVYGQEKDVATWTMARMNMILHGRVAAEIERDNALAVPRFTEGPGRLKRFDFAVANPPFSDKAWTNGLDPANDEYRRFEYGEPPARNGDLAFLLHLVASLNSTGKGAIIMPHGVLFRGNKEADIRRRLVRHGLIKGVIGLPANLFYGTGIPECIVVIDKENAVGRRGIFMIDASKGFRKDGAKNRLRERDIHRIVDVFTEQREVPGYSRLVPVDRDRQRGQRLQPQHPALHRLQRARGPARPGRAPTRWHPEPRHRRSRRLLGGVSGLARAALLAEWPGGVQRRADRGGRGAGGRAPTWGFQGVWGPRAPGVRQLAAGARAASARACRRGFAEGVDSGSVGGSAAPLRRTPAARPLRCLPVPDGLLGRGHAGRCVPGGDGGVDGGGAAAGAGAGQGQGDCGDTGSDREPEEVQDGSGASRACGRPVLRDGAGRG